MTHHNSESGESETKILVVIILVYLLLSASFAGVEARSGCCSHHGGVCSYQCPNGGIGYRCCDGTSQNPLLDGKLAINGKTLRIGAFNIQVFGTTKASKPEVLDVLGKIIRTYDIVAIQEIRDKSQTALPALVDTVNSDNSQYDYVVSERLGRTISKEQYAYIYNTQTVELTGAPQIYPES